MAIFRGVGGSGDSSDNSFLQEVTAQATAAEASRQAAVSAANATVGFAASANTAASVATTKADSILNLTAATGDAGTDASYNASTGVLTVPRGADGTDASVTVANVTAVGALMDSEVTNLAQVKAFDSSDYLTAHQDISGKANLSGANFTGNVNIGGFGNTVNLDVYGSTALYNGLNVVGDITVTGTVDGRDVAADGAKLDGIERTVRQRFQRRGYNNTISLNSLTTSYVQIGSSLRINSGATTAVENELDLNFTANFLDVNSSNEGLFVVTVDAPDPTTETTVNLGTVTGTSLGSFTVSGDFTKHFSPYCGMSKNSDGSNAFAFDNQQGWEYNPATNITTVYIYPYQANTPSTGAAVYLHPFDWESTGTEINGDEYPFEAYNASGTATQNHFHQIYLGYYKPERTFKIKARETATSENIQITRVAGTYSQIIGS